MKQGTDELKPELRFSEFRKTLGWKKIPLYEIAEPVSDKAKHTCIDNVLTLSAEHGIISQGEYFNKKIAGDNVERYIKIVRNDFVYNDRTTKQFTYGTIKRLSRYESGVVSPIYKCFRFKKSEDPVFWEWYFESGIHDYELDRLINEGARTGRFNISSEKFLSTSVWRPDLKEQLRIAECLSSINELVDIAGQNFVTLQKHKKGLMQQLFPAVSEVQE
jgi:type I restriction enzyme, S subunit